MCSQDCDHSRLRIISIPQETIKTPPKTLKREHCPSSLLGLKIIFSSDLTNGANKAMELVNTKE